MQTKIIVKINALPINHTFENLITKVNTHYIKPKKAYES